MPRRNDKRKGRRQTRSHASISTGSATAVAPAATRRNATPVPSVPTGGARSTQNSRGNRSAAGGRKPIKRAATSKKQNNKRGRGKKDKTQLQDLNCYQANNGEVYKLGDFAYVDSQQPELPYHICVIRDFKLARKDSVIAEVKWYYRVSELPEAVYSLLMEDRTAAKDSVMYENPLVRQRELFMAFNVDTHPASLFRGKCEVRELEKIPNVAEYMQREDCFFFCHGYKPESRRLTDMKEESLVPLSQQAQLPECRLTNERESSSHSNPDPNTSSPPVFDRYSQKEEPVHMEKLVWKPTQSDEQLLMFLRAARSIALHAGVCMTGYIADGFLAASSDETTQHAFDVLHKNGHDTEKALQDLVKHPTVSRLVRKKNWNKESTVLFAKGMRQFGKNFFKIKEELLPNKGIQELAEYYYFWKKTSAGLSSRSTRRQRKQLHIRMSRTPMKPRDPTPERVFMDLQSCDEDEGDGEDNVKATSGYYACRHCYTTVSSGWHHAGTNRSILCQTCRLHYQRYGHMKLLQDKGTPPDFMFKDFHTNELSQEEQPNILAALPPPTNGRKTRNSNGTRGVGSRPGLRSGKSYGKSDTDDEEEAVASDSSESSSEEEQVTMNKPKLLQTRRSILDNLDEGGRQSDEPPPKRPKREEDNEGNESEEEGSGDSLNGEGDAEGAQKSSEGTKSPSHSSSSSQVDDEGESPCSSRDSSDTLVSNTPQQFLRVTRNQEATCARTDLTYIHPPAEEKIAATDTNTVVPLPGPSSISHPGVDQPPLVSTPVLTPGQKVMITPHAPQLPMGPGPFVGFPVPYPMTPLSAGTPTVSHDNQFVRSVDQATAAAIREQEQHQMALWQQHQQQQQQQWLQAIHQQQKQMQEQLQSQFTPHVLPPHSNPHAHPGTAGHHSGASHVPFAPAHQSHSHSRPHPHSVDVPSSQPMAFNFPTPEEVLRQQRVAQLGLPLEAFAVGMFPQGVAPGMPLEHNHIVKLEEQHHQHQLAAAMAASGGVHLVPGMPHISMELLQQHQQQQQQQQQAVLAAAQASGMSPLMAPTAENLIDFQRQFEVMMQQVQKDPQLLQHPHVQQMIQQQRILAMHHHQQQLQGAAMHEQMIHNFQKAQEMMLQQQELQKHFVGNARPPHEDGHGRGVGRPPVIVQPK